MTDNATEKLNTRKSWLRRLALPLLFFAGGIGAAGWFVTSTEIGRNAVAIPPPAPILVDPARLAPPPANAPSADLGIRIGALEARLAQAEAATGPGAATGTSSRVTGLVLAFAARRAWERGQPLGEIESELRGHFANNELRFVDTISRNAKLGITNQKLKASFAELVPEIAGANATLWERFSNGMSSIISIRSGANGREGPEGLLNKAKVAVEAGDFETAINKLEQHPRRASAQKWLDDARQYVEMEKALDALEASAFAAPAAPQSTTPAAPAPPSPTEESQQSETF